MRQSIFRAHPAMAARKPSTIDRPRVIPANPEAAQRRVRAAAPKAARTVASAVGWPVRRSTAARSHPRSRFAHEVTHAFAGDDQLATLAIDVAEHRFGGGMPSSPIGLLESCMFMVGLLETSKVDPLDRLIKS